MHEAVGVQGLDPGCGPHRFGRLYAIQARAFHDQKAT